VHVELQVEVLRRELVDRPGDTDARGVDEYVEPAVAVAMLLDDSAAVVFSREVGDHPEGSELLRSSFDLLARPTDEGQVEIFRSQAASDGEADTGRTARDKRSPRHEPSLQLTR